MAQHIVLTILVAITLMMPAIATAGNMPSKKGATVKEVKAMSEKDQTALALSGAPAHIAKEAGIMIYGPDGKLTETIAPAVFAALETHVNNWLTLRFGANKPAYEQIKAENKINGKTAKLQFSPFQMNLGAGVKLVKQDAALKQELGAFTFDDVVRELEKPGRDPRLGPAPRKSRAKKK